jgi:hypothetical protein
MRPGSPVLTKVPAAGQRTACVLEPLAGDLWHTPPDIASWVGGEAAGSPPLVG